MSTRTTFRPMQVITSGAMTANITSAVTILGSLSRFSYEISWAGTSPVGTVAVQVSNSYSVLPTGVVNNAGTWTTVAVPSGTSTALTIAVTGNSGNLIIDPVVSAAYAVRLLYTFTSGTGTLNAYINAKVD